MQRTRRISPRRVENKRKREREAEGESERKRDGETGDAATKDNSCSAGGDVNFCAVGQCYCRRREASRDKTLSDFTSGSAGPPRDPSPPPSPPALSSSRYAKLPRVLRLVSSLVVSSSFNRTDTDADSGARGSGPAPLPRTHLHLEKPAEFL